MEWQTRLSVSDDIRIPDECAHEPNIQAVRDSHLITFSHNLLRFLLRPCLKLVLS